MTAFRVTPAELLALSQQVQGTAGSIESELGTLRGRVLPISGSWTGQAQDRWAHLLSGAEAAATAGRATPGAGAPASRSSGGRVDELAQRVEQLEARVARLEQALGMEDDQAAS